MGKVKEKGFEAHLLAEIKKSGFPLEIEVSEVLEKGRFGVLNTVYYFDEELKLGRSIDVHGLPYGINDLEDKLAPLSFRVDLVIECKKSQSHAWVLYSRPRMSYKAIFINGQLYTSVTKEDTEAIDSFENSVAEHMKLHYESFDRIAVAYDEVKIAGLEKDSDSHRRDIFEAINQLVKFQCYEGHEVLNRSSKRYDLSSDSDFIMFTYPIIVFDGELFEVTFDKGEPSLNRTKHALLQTHYRCPYCKNVQYYTFDVVHRSYFEEYVKLIETSTMSTMKSLIQKRDALLSRAKEDKATYQKELGKKITVS